MRGVIRRSAILGLGILGPGILACLLVFHLLAVVLDHTPRGGAQNGMMSGDMADDTADGGPFQASFGISHGGQQRETDGNGETGSKLAHFHSPCEYR
jgi:hypothetical protein